MCIIIFSNFGKCGESSDVSRVVLDSSIAFATAEQVLDGTSTHRKADIAVDDTPAAACVNVSVFEFSCIGACDDVVKVAIMLGFVGAEEVGVDEQAA